MRKMLGLVSVLLLVAACGDTTAVSVGDVWARTSASMQDAGAVYMTIGAGEQGDSLIGVEVGGDVAARAEIHETMMMEDEEDSGMMQMHAVESIPVPSGGEVKLEPGGFHIMLIKLTEPLEEGSEFALTLIFEEFGEIEVTVEVREG